MLKLTDTQRAILSNAAKRRDGAVLPLPKSLKIKGAAVTKVLDSLHKKGLLEERPARGDAVGWREDEDGHRLMLLLSEAGLRAISGETTDAQKQPIPAKPKSKKPRRHERRSEADTKPGEAAAAPRKGSKQALLLEMLKRKRGSNLREMVAATGWQAHSVRGAISGTVKKKLGLTVVSDKVDGRGRVYRIAAKS
jgi:uncharacterized protein DUF3489